VHDDALFTVLDNWVSSLHGDDFQAILPLLRRTFSTFEAPERRNIGQKAKAGIGAGSSISISRSSDDLNHDRGALVLPLIRQMLGLEYPSTQP
jgi:Family of unknown function (DUF5682)